MSTQFPTLDPSTLTKNGSFHRMPPMNIDNGKHWFVFSTSHEGLHECLGGLGSYYVAPAKDGEDYGPGLEIASFVPQLEDKGDDTPQYSYHTGESVARNILCEHLSDVLSPHTRNATVRGFFVSQNNPPLPHEVKAAKDKRIKWLQYLVDEANQAFQGGRMSEIHSYHRTAASELKAKVAWAQAVDLADVCPYCGTSIRANVAKCPNCREIVNFDIYNSLQARLGSSPQPDEEPKPRRGRPPKVQEEEGE